VSQHSEYDQQRLSFKSISEAISPSYRSRAGATSSKKYEGSKRMWVMLFEKTVRTVRRLRSRAEQLVSK